MNAIVQNLLEENNGVITSEMALQKGLSKALLPFYVKKGLLERMAHGIYARPGELPDDLYTIALRSPMIVFSHETALFLNGLSDRTPFTNAVSIPSDRTLSRGLKSECSCHYVAPSLFDIGKTVLPTTFGHPVPCYDAERTICDVVKARAAMGIEMVSAAMRNYAASANKDLNRLSEYAEKLNVFDSVNRYLEVLL